MLGKIFKFLFNGLINNIFIFFFFSFQNINFKAVRKLLREKKIADSCKLDTAGNNTSF